MKALSILIILAVVFLSSEIEAKRFKGTLKTSTSDNWVPITQFYFGGGWSPNVTTRYINYTIRSEKIFNLAVVLYDDESEDWDYVWKNRNSLTCQQKLDPQNNPAYVARIENVTADNVGTLMHTGIDDHGPRKWVVVIADCGSDQLDLSYDFYFKNNGGSREIEFSLEEQGLYGLYIAFFIMYFLLVIGHLYGVYQLYTMESFHPIVKLLTASILLEFFSIMFKMIHTSSYSTNGVGSFGSFVFGQILNFCSQMVFMFLLILLARGYGISHHDLGNRRFLLIALVGFLVLFFSWFVWKAVLMHQPLYPLFAWGTAPGILWLLTRIAVLAYFLFHLRSSHVVEGHPTKRRFYVVFGGLGIFWFLYIPFVVMFVALIYMHNPWMTEKSVTGNNLILNWFAFIGMTYLFWPSQISKYFEVSKSDMLISSSSPTSPYETL